MKLKQIPWVIVQAGGKGKRLEHYTWNKPKCLLPVGGQPILYNLFDCFESANFLVVGDYLYDILEKYVQVFPPNVPVELIQAKSKGTISGIDMALSYIPDRSPFLLIWCDLLLREVPDCNVDGKNWIGLSRSFKCRWSYNSLGQCVEEASEERGIAGFFIFENKEFLKEIPSAGECVRWFSEQPIQFNELFLDHAYELGTLDNLVDYQNQILTSRFFNSVEVVEDKIVKQARVAEFEALIQKELNWYRTVADLGFERIPKLISDTPMTISLIDGVHPFELTGDLKQKEAVLSDIFQTLEKLHRLNSTESDLDVMAEVYLRKTQKRVQTVANLIPDLDQETLKINGYVCRNPFHGKYESLLNQAFAEITKNNGKFTTIHGDPTFSNMLIDGQKQAWLIDPRGYFGSVLIYGDPMYDWAKLYYSVVGNYDLFNRRRFKLKMFDDRISLEIESNGWEELESMFEDKFGNRMRVIRLLHALIWISFCGYVKDDYDSILASFYNGVLWLEKSLK